MYTVVYRENELNRPGKEEASYLRGQVADIQNESSPGIRKMIAT